MPPGPPAVRTFMPKLGFCVLHSTQCGCNVGGRLCSASFGSRICKRENNKTHRESQRREITALKPFTSKPLPCNPAAMEPTLQATQPNRSLSRRQSIARWQSYRKPCVSACFSRSLVDSLPLKLLPCSILKNLRSASGSHWHVNSFSKHITMRAASRLLIQYLWQARQQYLTMTLISIRWVEITLSQ